MREKDITIVTTGSEKNSFTTVLAVPADGHKLTPMVIFKRKTIPKEKFPANILVRANAKGWINGELMEDWMKNVFLKRPSEFFAKTPKEKCLLIYDSCTAHLTPEVKTVVENHTKLAIIPGGLTKFLQPLDISVNKSFKSHLRNSWEIWMGNDEMISITKGGNRRKATFATVCEWIVSAWEEVSVDTIKHGFEKAGIHSYNDGTTIANHVGVGDNLENEEPASSSGMDTEDENQALNVSEVLENFELLQIDDDDDLVGDEFDGWEDID